MTNTIIRAAHPAAPITPTVAPLYDLARWIRAELPEVTDAETRLFLIGELGKVTQASCTKGYQRAGFHVVGVDIEPQPRYCGDGFIQMCALEFLERYLNGEYPEADAFGASPPCHAYSSMRHVTGRTYPELIEPIRNLLIATGKPYIIENVEGAPLFNAIMLCGTMFGLKTFRHRLFESNVFMLMPPHITHTLFGKAAKQGRPTTADRQYLTVTGNFSGIACGRRAMGIDWMNKQELTQAIPPVYTQWIGERLLESMAVKSC